MDHSVYESIAHTYSSYTSKQWDKIYGSGRCSINFGAGKKLEVRGKGRHVISSFLSIPPKNVSAAITTCVVTENSCNTVGDKEKEGGNKASVHISYHISRGNDISEKRKYILARYIFPKSCPVTE